MDPSLPPAAGTGEPLASVCSQGDSADPLGTHRAAAREGNFAAKEKSVQATACISNPKRLTAHHSWPGHCPHSSGRSLGRSPETQGRASGKLGDATRACIARCCGRGEQQIPSVTPGHSSSPAPATLLALAHPGAASPACRALQLEKSPGCDTEQSVHCSVAAAREARLQGPELLQSVAGWMHSPSITSEFCRPECRASSLLPPQEGHRGSLIRAGL